MQGAQQAWRAMRTYSEITHLASLPPHVVDYVCSLVKSMARLWRCSTCSLLIARCRDTCIYANKLRALATICRFCVCCVFTCMFKTPLTPRHMQCHSARRHIRTRNTGSNSAGPVISLALSRAHFFLSGHPPLRIIAPDAYTGSSDKTCSVYMYIVYIALYGFCWCTFCHIACQCVAPSVLLLSRVFDATYIQPSRVAVGRYHM